MATEELVSSIHNNYYLSPYALFLSFFYLLYQPDDCNLSIGTP